MKCKHQGNDYQRKTGEQLGTTNCFGRIASINKIRMSQPRFCDIISHLHWFHISNMCRIQFCRTVAKVVDLSQELNI